jgi:hypothetical protein
MAAAAAVWLVAALHFVTAPEEVLLSVVPDDAFYYLQIARNLVRVGQSTADGVANTNGFHPLWMMMCSGLAWLFPATGLFLRAAVAMSLLLHGAVAVAIRYALGPVVGVRWAWTAAACWLTNKLAFLIAQQTVESMPYALALLTVLILHMRLARALNAKSSIHSRRQVIWYGAALGVLCLARTDGLVVAGLALLWIAVRGWMATGSVRQPLVSAATAGGVCLLVLIPWIAFSIAQVGTVVQDSGAMKMLWASSLHSGEPLSSRIGDVVVTIDFFVRQCLRLMIASNLSNAALLPICLALALPAAWMIIRRGRVDHARALTATIVPVLALSIIYGWAMTEQQLWWLTLPCLGIVLVAFTSVPAALEGARINLRGQEWLQVALILMSVVIFIHSQRTASPPYPWQVDVRKSQVAIEALVPATERIGSFNAGIPIFFGSKRIVALDGIVSHPAQAAWRQHNLDGYLRAQGIRYVADEQQAVDRAMRFAQVRPVFTRVATFPLKGWPTNERVLWEITWPTTAAVRRRLTTDGLVQ